MSKHKIINTIKETFTRIARNHCTECKICGYIVFGSSFGTILEKLAEHGERTHPGYIKGETK
jgi:hypothetical protein